MRVDVAVVGGGPAGTACALTLLRYSALRVAVIERGDYTGPRIGETIGPGLRPLLAYLGLWARFLAGHHRVAHATAAAWGSDEIFRQEFFFTGRGHGWHLDRARFDLMLAQAVSEAGGTVLPGHAFHSLSRAKGDRWRLIARLPDSSRVEIAARFVVDATGRAALVARHLGAQIDIVDRLVGVTGFVELEKPLEDERFALVEARGDGWWYSACLPRERMVIAFMSDADLVRDLDAQHFPGWRKLLASTRHTRGRVSSGTLPATLVARSAGSQCLRPFGGGGWIAVGDAAAAFDPLSSMGIGHALSTGMHGARAVGEALDGGGELQQEYFRGVAQNFKQFLNFRRSFYNVEQRWKERPFWLRRHRTSEGT